MEDFGRISDYYKNEGGIKSIYEFLIQLFEGKKDKIKKENNEIIIELNYTLGIKEDEITLRLSKKEIGLEATLNNIDKSLKEIKKDNIESKIEFKKDLLEKVYPIGSYYWSSSDISPQTLFGGIWTKIKGRFFNLPLIHISHSFEVKFHKRNFAFRHYNLFQYLLGYLQLHHF
jgi:hypothetical protein